MNTEIFIQLLERVSDSDWQAIVGGQALCMIDDERLEVGDSDNNAAIVKNTIPGRSHSERFKQEVINDAESILQKYYFIHPLTQAGFNRQAKKLIKLKGAKAFAATSGNLPEFSLFVDGGELLAEGADSPRHRYGAFCEIEKMPAEPVIVESRVIEWLQNNEAYELYLNMNVCRYNC